MDDPTKGRPNGHTVSCMYDFSVTEADRIAQLFVAIRLMELQNKTASF